jgi:hypothetical protein
MTQIAEDLQQPALTAEQHAEALAALVPATFRGMPPTAQTFYAVVRADGTLARGFEAVSAAKLGTGMYQVLFAHDITGTAYLGTIGLDTTSVNSPSGQNAVVGRLGAPSCVFDQTYDAAGQYEDRGVHMVVAS